jgi:hypothetical protein
MFQQNSEATVVVDNIHSIVAAAAMKFNMLQIENLVTLVKEVLYVFTVSLLVISIFSLLL